MKFEELKKIINTARVNSQFSLATINLESNNIDNIAENLFPDKKINLINVANFDVTADNQIIIRGTGVDLPFAGMAVEIKFYLLNNEAALSLTATGDLNWTFSTGFPILQTSVVAAFSFLASAPPQLQLDSDLQKEQVRLDFNGIIDLNAIDSGLANLIGRSQQRLDGKIELAENGSSLRHFDLTAPISEQVDLGIAKVDQLSFEIGGNLTYNFIEDRYSLIPYIGLGARIPFKIQGSLYHIPVAAQIADLGRDFRFNADLTEGIDAAMHEISVLTNGVGLESFLPDQFHLEDFLRIQDFFFDFNLNNPNKVNLIGVDIASANQWKIFHFNVANKDLVVDNISLSLRLRDPFGAKSAWVGISGEMAIGKSGCLVVSAHYPDFLISGYLKENTTLNLGEIIAEFVGPDIEVPALDVYHFCFDLSVENFEIDAEFTGCWAIDNLPLQVDQVRLELTHSGGNSRALISGYLNISTVNIFILAQYLNADQGWHFEGGLKTNRAIPIDTLIGGLAGVFGDITLPSIIHDLIIDDLHVSFTTKNKGFSFTCKSSFMIETITFNTNFAIDIKRQDDDTFQKQLAGELSFKGMTFNLDIIAGDNTSNTLKASMEKVQLSEIVQTLLGIPLPPGLPDLIIEKLALEIDTEKNIRIAGKVTLSDSECRHLTLGGTQLPLASVQFDFQRQKTAGAEQYNTGVSIRVTGDIGTELISGFRCNHFDFKFGYSDNQGTQDWELEGNASVSFFETTLDLGAAYLSKQEDKFFNLYLYKFQDITPDKFTTIDGINQESAQAVWDDLKTNGYLDRAGKLNPPKFVLLDKSAGLKLPGLSDPFKKYETDIINVLFSTDPLITLPGAVAINIRTLDLSVCTGAAEHGWDFSASGDLELYDPTNPQKIVFCLKNGILSLSGSSTPDNTSVKLEFIAAEARLTSPRVDYTQVVKEQSGNITQSVTIEKSFGFDVDFRRIEIEKAGNDWSFGGEVGFYLLGLPSPVDQMFPATEQGIIGTLEVKKDSKQQYQVAIGVTGRTGPLAQIPIPDLFELINREMSQNQNTNTNPLPGLGEGCFTLEGLRLELSNDLSLEIVTGLGLPAKLNELIGLKPRQIIKTYDGTTKSLIRTSFTLGTDGISGAVLDSPLQEIKGIKDIIINGKAWIEVDLDIVLGEKNLGLIRFQKPELAFDLNKGCFKISGGYQIDPVRGFKLPLFPLRKVFEILTQPELAKAVPDGIPVKSIKLIEDKVDRSGKTTRCLATGGLQELFKQVGLEIPREFYDVITKVDQVIEKLPERFVDYLNIKIPQGLTFSLELTGDGDVSFALEVDQLGDPLQLLIPTGGPMLMGLRLYRLAFGTAFADTVLKVEVNTEIDIFNLILLAQALILPENGPWSDFLPGRTRYQQTFVIRNLITVIIYETEVPIPVPLFYDELSMFQVAFDGSELKFDIAFPKPSFNARELLQRFNELKKFFTTPYNKSITDNQGTVQGLLPIVSSALKPDPALTDNRGTGGGAKLDIRFSAGPIYLKLPKYLGNRYQFTESIYQQLKSKIAPGAWKNLNQLERKFFASKKILTTGLQKAGISANEINTIIAACVMDSGQLIGTEHEYTFSAWDLAYTILNFSKITISNQKPAMNYLLQRFPLEDRVNNLTLSLFDTFDISVQWLITTPQEFGQISPNVLRDWPRDQFKEVMAGAPGSDEEGLVVFLKGATRIEPDSEFSVMLGLAATEKTGFGTGFRITGVIAKFVDMELGGYIAINPNPGGNSSPAGIVRLSGHVHLRIPMLSQEIFAGDIGYLDNSFTLSGKLNLFPTQILFQVHGDLKGNFNSQGFLLQGEVNAGIKGESIEGAKIRISNQEFLLEGKWFVFNSTFNLAALDATGVGVRFQQQGTMADFINISTDGNILIKFDKIHGCDGFDSFELEGNCALKVLNRTIMNGQITAGEQSLNISGTVDLFPGINIVSAKGNVTGRISRNDFSVNGFVTLTAGNVKLIDGDCKIAIAGIIIFGNWLGNQVVFKALIKDNDFVLNGSVSFNISITQPFENIIFANVKVANTLMLNIQAAAVIDASLSAKGFSGKVQVSFALMERNYNYSFNLNVTPVSAEDLRNMIIKQIRNDLENFFKMLFAGPDEWVKGIKQAILRFQPSDISGFMGVIKGFYQCGSEEAARVLKNTGYFGVEEITCVLKTAYNLGDKAVSIALKNAGFEVEQIAQSLKKVYNLGEDALHEVLKGVGFAEEVISNIIHFKF
jgi:hypothetical protein